MSPSCSPATNRRWSRPTLRTGSSSTTVGGMWPGGNRGERADCRDIGRRRSPRTRARTGVRPTRLVPSLQVAYIWHASRHACVVQAGLERVGFEVRQQIIWDKELFVLSRQHYHWQHEPCFYATRKGASASVVWAAEPVDGVERAEPEDGCRAPDTVRVTARSTIRRRSRCCCTGARSRITCGPVSWSMTRSRGAGRR